MPGNHVTKREWQNITLDFAESFLADKYSGVDSSDIATELFRRFGDASGYVDELYALIINPETPAAVKMRGHDIIRRYVDQAEKAGRVGLQRMVATMTDEELGEATKKRLEIVFEKMVQSKRIIIETDSSEILDGSCHGDLPSGRTTTEDGSAELVRAAE